MSIKISVFLFAQPRFLRRGTQRCDLLGAGDGQTHETREQPNLAPWENPLKNSRFHHVGGGY